MSVPRALPKPPIEGTSTSKLRLLAAAPHVKRQGTQHVPMSIYDQREESAYRGEFRPYRNRDFDKWWSQEHDDLIVRLIDQYQWNWYWEISDEIEGITPDDVMSALRQQHAWYNKVMYHAIARAEALGLAQNIRTPQRKQCPLCQQYFTEDSLPHSLVKRLGIDQLDFCAPCLKECVLQGSGNNLAGKDEIIEFIRRLTVNLEKIPPQGFGEGMDDLIDLAHDKRVELLRLLNHKPSTKRVRAVFGSWLKALIEAGVLLDGTRETPRGTQTLALDGHVCLSLGEKTIDDYLYKRGIVHEKEPKYPERNYRADFSVGGVFIEYFGLAGESSYDAKIEEKKRICAAHGIKLIALYPTDLVTITRLESRLSTLGLHASAP